MKQREVEARIPDMKIVIKHDGGSSNIELMFMPVCVTVGQNPLAMPDLNRV